MLTTSELVNIFLPSLSHWVLWLSFLVVIAGVLFLYAYPYIKKPRKEFRYQHIGIPVVNVVSFYIFTKLFEGVLYHGSILKVDEWFSEFVLSLRSSSLINLASFITNFGGSWVIYVLLIVTIGVLLLKKRWRFAILSTIAILGATILQLVIKNLVHRARPENLLETTYSFPSGHAITAIVYVSLLIYSFKDDFKNKTVKYMLITLASAFFIAVGISRIVLHVHWFSDVLAGMALGLFWFMLVVLVERSITGLVPAVKVETKKAASKPFISKK